MELLNYNKTKFEVAHFQGQSFYGYPFWKNYFFNLKFECPKDLDVITVYTNEEDALLKQQNNWVKSIKHDCYLNGGWQNTFKPKYIIEALENSDKDICMVCDANDVLICGNLNESLTKFKTLYKNDILFCATKNNYPKVNIDLYPDRDLRGEFKYLNAGCCIGYRDKLIDFYRYVYEISQYPEIIKNNKLNSEQYVIRIAADDLKDNINIDFDWQCNIFQTFGMTKIIKENKNYIIV